MSQEGRSWSPVLLALAVGGGVGTAGSTGLHVSLSEPAPVCDCERLVDDLTVARRAHAEATQVWVRVCRVSESDP